ILVAPVDRASRRADSALAFVNGVNKTFAVLHREDHVIPESKTPGSQAGFVESGTQVLNLRGLSRAVHSGEADQQGLTRLFLGGWFHGSPEVVAGFLTFVWRPGYWRQEAWRRCRDSTRTRFPRRHRQPRLLRP